MNQLRLYPFKIINISLSNKFIIKTLELLRQKEEVQVNSSKFTNFIVYKTLSKYYDIDIKNDSFVINNTKYIIKVIKYNSYEPNTGSLIMFNSPNLPNDSICIICTIDLPIIQIIGYTKQSKSIISINDILSIELLTDLCNKDTKKLFI